MTVTEFDELVRRATGFAPYPYQRRLAGEGLPEVLGVPTGTGKTVAAVLPWLYRRRFHPDLAVREATPRRLVYVLPMRTLVEQTAGLVPGWLLALGLTDDVGVQVLMGGEPRLAEWRTRSDQDMVIIGTQDMIVSRALNRGYGDSRFLWPIDFGLLNNDCQYVFDEVQLMGPALATTRQLEGLRRKLGTAAACRSMWMSATVDESALTTYDAPDFGLPVELSGDDLLDGALAGRLAATKQVAEVASGHWTKHSAELAEMIAAEHVPGTLTLAITNTVDRATALHAALGNARGEAELVLVHSRFRPRDREAVVGRVTAPLNSSGPGRIVVSTQVVEAGLDISSTTLITEAAPWPSVVQRAGRCNRDGRAGGARLLWVEPPKPEPYVATDVAASVAALRSLEGELVTSQTLRDQPVEVSREIHPVLRRRDLFDLFDTLPDLSGSDVDVGRFIRDSTDLDVSVAWRVDAPGTNVAGADDMPTRNERCPVPVGQFRQWLQKRQKGDVVAWRWNHLSERRRPGGASAEGQWVPCRVDDVRPGAVVIVSAAAGGYRPEFGWSPTSHTAVAPPAEFGDPAADDQSTGDDPASSRQPFWVALRDHLADAEREAVSLVASVDPRGLLPEQRAAVVSAARPHDIGKAHPVFQESVRNTVGAGESAPPEHLVLAKSAGTRRLRHSVRNFRHELASALALLGEGRVALDGLGEPDLVVYLVAAHHGRVRLGLRSLPGDERRDGPSAVLGIEHRAALPMVELPGGELPASVLDLGVVSMGQRDGAPSWSERAIALRDRPDIGPFRLGFMEALVRLADWSASAEPTEWSEGEVAHD